MPKFPVICGEEAYRQSLLQEVTPETDWLDLGCGWRLLRDWLPNGVADEKALSTRARRLVGIDFVLQDVERNPYLREKVVGDLSALPFRAGSFSLVTAQMVVEHLERPVEFLREVKRVLAPGGKLIFLTPNYLHYQVFTASLLPDALKRQIVRYLEGREEKDVFKTYYRMNTEGSIRKMASDSGFQVLAIRMLHQVWEFRRIPPLHAIEKWLYHALDTNLLQNLRPQIVAILTNPCVD